MKAQAHASLETSMGFSRIQSEELKENSTPAAAISGFTYWIQSEELKATSAWVMVWIMLCARIQSEELKGDIDSLESKKVWISWIQSEELKE